MSKSHDNNPYESSTETAASVDARRRWPALFVVCIGSYYLLSALTLPFANKVWLGELPVFGIFQLPKSLLKSIVHGVLMSAMKAAGLSHGSFSPDYAATHGWAMGMMVTAPALLAILVLISFQRFPHRHRLIAVIVVCAALDAVVTLWFDNASNLKLYNASFF